MDGYVLIHSADIYHHGIKGQKWGVRRWQNEDGSLTEAGREHYGLKGAKYKQKIEDWDEYSKSMPGRIATNAAISVALTGAAYAFGGPKAAMTAALINAGFDTGVALTWPISKLLKSKNEKRLEETRQFILDHSNESADDLIKSKENEAFRSDRYNRQAYRIVNNQVYTQLLNARKKGDWDTYEKLADDLNKSNVKYGPKTSLDFQEWTQNDIRRYDTSWVEKEYKKYSKDPEAWLNNYQSKFDDENYRRKYQE